VSRVKDCAGKEMTIVDLAARERVLVGSMPNRSVTAESHDDTSDEVLAMIALSKSLPLEVSCVELGSVSFRL
jgi:hypothetical protein